MREELKELVKSMSVAYMNAQKHFFESNASVLQFADLRIAYKLGMIAMHELPRSQSAGEHEVTIKSEGRIFDPQTREWRLVYTVEKKPAEASPTAGERGIDDRLFQAYARIRELEAKLEDSGFEYVTSVSSMQKRIAELTSALRDYVSLAQQTGAELGSDTPRLLLENAKKALAGADGVKA